MNEKTKQIIEKILDTEQFVYTDDGTRTYRGIVYDLHAKKLAEKYDINSWEELKQAHDDVVIRFYYDEYIVPSHAEDFIEVSVNLAYQIADFAVNEGVSCTIKGIQKLQNIINPAQTLYDCRVSVKVDGIYGRETKMAISYLIKYIKNNHDINGTVFTTYQKIRESHYFSKLANIRKKYGDKKCMDFLQSWNRRCDFRFDE